MNYFLVLIQDVGTMDQFSCIRIIKMTEACRFSWCLSYENYIHEGNLKC